VALAGCDTLYGVSRGAPLTSVPDAACVENVIRSTPGIQHVRSERRPDSRSITFAYDGSEPRVWGFLVIGSDDPGGPRFEQYQYVMNRPADPVAVANTRSVMRQIEFGLASRCGMPYLPGAIRERCEGVACPGLH